MSALRPQTQYARVGEADIAYQVLGEGPPDLVLFGGLGYHVELSWQIPDLVDIFTRLEVARIGDHPPVVGLARF